MDKDKLTADYNEGLRNNELETSELTTRKKALEEKREKLYEFKRRSMAHYNQVRTELRGDERKQDLKMVDQLVGEAQHVCRLTEQGLEKEAGDIERQRKQLSAQRDALQADYRRDIRNLEKGGQAT